MEVGTTGEVRWAQVPIRLVRSLCNAEDKLRGRETIRKNHVQDRRLSNDFLIERRVGAMRIAEAFEFAVQSRLRVGSEICAR